MTREEKEKVIDLLDNLIGVMEDNQGNDYDFALRKGIEALEKENVLDKIRAEIIAESFPEDDEYSLSNMVYLKDVLDIIDKYKAECEEQE